MPEEFLKAALQAIPSAASNPLSLIAFVCLIAAWVFISYRVTRNKQVLSHIKDIPENQRADIVRAEMGTVIPPNSSENIVQKIKNLLLRSDPSFQLFRLSRRV